MKAPFVSRDAYDDMAAQRDYFRDRVEALTADLLAMRRDGFSQAKPATIHEPADEEVAALQVAERQLVQRRNDSVFVQRAVKDIMQKTGVSESQARAEAIRLRRAVTDEDAPL